MELENLYVVINEMMEIIPSLNNTIVKKEMEDDLYISGIDIFIESLQLTLELSYEHGDIDDNELEYLGNLIDSLSINQLRTEIEFLKICNECIKSA